MLHFALFNHLLHFLYPIPHLLPHSLPFTLLLLLMLIRILSFMLRCLGRFKIYVKVEWAFPATLSFFILFPRPMIQSLSTLLVSRVVAECYQLILAVLHPLKGKLQRYRPKMRITNSSVPIASRHICTLNI